MEPFNNQNPISAPVAPLEPLKNKRRLSLPIDLRLLVIVLLIVIGVILFLWKPWVSEVSSNDRTIDVTGAATLTAEPDQFVFSPTYSIKNTDKDASLKELTKKSDDLVAGLKKVGVSDSDIKTNASDYGSYYYFYTSGGTYTLNLTVTAKNKDMAQKVQDFLLTTSPSGAISPTADFSTNKRQELENEARDKATKDARSKADQSAKNLGFKIAGVKTVNDDSGFGEISPLLYGTNSANLDTGAASPKLSVQPGENELSYSVQVTYYIK